MLSKCWTNAEKKYFEMPFVMFWYDTITCNIRFCSVSNKVTKLWTDCTLMCLITVVGGFFTQLINIINFLKIFLVREKSEKGT